MYAVSNFRSLNFIIALKTISHKWDYLLPFLCAMAHSTLAGCRAEMTSHMVRNADN